MNATTQTTARRQIDEARAASSNSARSTQRYAGDAARHADVAQAAERGAQQAAAAGRPEIAMEHAYSARREHTKAEIVLRIARQDAATTRQFAQLLSDLAVHDDSAARDAEIAWTNAAFATNAEEAAALSVDAADQAAHSAMQAARHVESWKDNADKATAAAVETGKKEQAATAALLQAAALFGVRDGSNTAELEAALAEAAEEYAAAIEEHEIALQAEAAAWTLVHTGRI